MLKRLTILIYLALLPLLLSSPAAAQEHVKGLTRNILTVFAPPNAEQEKKIAETVGMSSEQKTKMKAVNERYRQDASALRNKYQAAYNDAVKLMQSTDPNKANVNQVLKTFHQVHSEVVNREVGYWMDFKSILTPEQNQKFWNLFEQSRVRGAGAGKKQGTGK